MELRYCCKCSFRKETCYAKTISQIEGERMATAKKSTSTKSTTTKSTTTKAAEDNAEKVEAAKAVKTAAAAETKPKRRTTKKAVKEEETAAAVEATPAKSTRKRAVKTAEAETTTAPETAAEAAPKLSLIHISEPTRH